MSDLGDAQWIHDGPPPTGPDGPPIVFQDAETVAHEWHQLMGFQRQEIREEHPKLAQALDDLLEAVVED